MKKVLFVVSSHGKMGSSGEPTGYYVPEAAHPWAVLKDAGYAVEFASPQGGQPPRYGTDKPDAVVARFLADPEVTKQLTQTLRTAEVKASDYEAILFVGGHGTMWDFPEDKGSASVAAHLYETGGVVAAVCHGPAALVNLTLSNGHYLVEGKKVAAFTDAEEQAIKLDTVVPFLLASTLQSRGAEHVAAPNWQANVVVDGRLVTGQNPASAEGVGHAVLKLLQTR